MGQNYAWYTWIFGSMCTISAQIGRFFSVKKKAQILHTKGRSRYTLFFLAGKIHAST